MSISETDGLIKSYTYYVKYFVHANIAEQITVAEWSKGWIVLTRLDAVIVGSNPTWGMDV
jgi:hypothetical protein